MKRTLLGLLGLGLLVVGLRPTAAQTESLAAWAPATANAFFEIAVANPDEALRGLNVGAFVGSYLQPTRPALEGVQPFDTFFPLDLLDLESASFSELIVPWLGDAIGVAYGDLSLPEGPASNDVLLILPSRDPFEAASFLSSVVEGQDLLQSETLEGAALYVGDRAAIALTPEAVLIGSDAMVRAALAVEAGAVPSLAATDGFQALSAALPADRDLRFYAAGEASRTALPALFSLTGEAEPLMAAYGEVLGSRAGADLPASAWLRGEAQAVGVALDLSASITRRVTADVAVFAPDASLPASAAFNPDLLALIPRRAMLVWSTADAATFAEAALSALPFSASGPALLSAIPLQSPLPAGVVALPDARSAQFVIDSLLTALDGQGLSWDALRGPLTGSALLALLPRPNDPLPVTNALADILVVAESDEAYALAEQVNQLLTAYQIPVVDEANDSGLARYRVTPDGTSEPVLQFAAADGLFLLGTGEAVDDALRAQAGDNRLIDQPRWELAGAPAPGLYLDMDRLYNTFLSTAGGATTGPVNLVGLTGGPAVEGVYQLSAVVTVTLGN